MRIAKSETWGKVEQDEPENSQKFKSKKILKKRKNK